MAECVIQRTWRLRMTGGLICLALTIIPARAGEVFSRAPGAQEGPTLTELVEAFFRSDDVKERASLITAIEQAADSSVETVAKALGNVQLWSPCRQSQGAFAFDLAVGEAMAVAYHLPTGYDPARRHPLMICMPDRSAASTETFALARHVLGESADTFILIGPTRPIGGLFHQPVAAGEDLRRLIRDVRRRFHVDTDRTLLFGAGLGGDAAWMAAITHPDLFAGVIVLAGYPRVLYPEQVYPLLLGNLPSLPVLNVWYEADDPAAPLRRRAVAAHNRAITAIAKRQSLPIVSIEVPYRSPGTLKPPAGELEAMLTRTRSAPPRAVSQWFRYPAHGRAGWLTQTGFKGDVWETDQLSILPSPATDRDEFIGGIIDGKLAYVGGSIDGQTITIETQKCARIDLLLPAELLNLDEPITVRCNGQNRHTGPIRPTIRTLLETARDRWAFQRLTPARLSITIKSDRKGK